MGKETVVFKFMNHKLTKIIFFGTPEFVVSLPQALFKTDFNLVTCVTAPDRPIGRKKVLTPSAVKVWAEKNKIPVIDSPSIEEIYKKVKKKKPTVGILAAYGKIIPKKLIKVFPKEILVVHPSLLPKYRGASPVQAAIAHGDKEIGVSIFKMDEKLDHGPIISQFKKPLSQKATPDKLYPELFSEAACVLATILPAYLKGRIKARKQDHVKATFCRTLKKDDGFIPPQFITPKQGWTSECSVGPYKLEPTPENLERFIRAMHPWPGAFTNVKIKNQISKRLKILKAHLKNKKLVLDQVQLEGKKPVSWKEFKRGYPEAKFSD